MAVLLRILKSRLLYYRATEATVAILHGNHQAVCNLQVAMAILLGNSHVAAAILVRIL